LEQIHNKNLIVKEVHHQNFLKAFLHNKGIIEIHWDPSIDNIETIHLKKMQETVYELGAGQKMPLLFMPHEFLHLTDEGAKYAVSDEGVRYTLAIAVLVDDLAKKLLFNFFLRINKPKKPTKGFSTKAEAFEWLLEIQKKNS